jgi:hypothetical protein
MDAMVALPALTAIAVMATMAVMAMVSSSTGMQYYRYQTKWIQATVWMTMESSLAGMESEFGTSLLLSEYIQCDLTNRPSSGLPR